MKVYLVGLDENEDVVHPNSQHQEWDDFNHNEGEGDPDVAEDAQWTCHWAQHNEDTRDAEGDFRIHLRCNRDPNGQSYYLSHYWKTLILPLYTGRANPELKVQFHVWEKIRKMF